MPRYIEEMMIKKITLFLSLSLLLAACGGISAEADPLPTLAPTTLAPTTSVPTTSAPTTSAPTTSALAVASVAATVTGEPLPPTAETLTDSYPGGTSTPIPPVAMSDSAEAYPADTINLGGDGATTPLLDYAVVGQYLHDPNAFTQGFDFDETGQLYESTGLWGRSSVRKVDPGTGEVLQQIALDDAYFGEGITIFDDRIIQITWQSKTGFIYDKESLQLLDSWSYDTEGWGLTQDGEQIIMSDGTATITFRDPDTLEPVRTIQVTDENGPVVRLNELEYIDGLIWANIWQTNLIALIDPATGVVVNYLDLTGLLPAVDRTGSEDVLNGIAYDETTGRLLVTGKLWPKVFELEILQ